MRLDGVHEASKALHTSGLWDILPQKHLNLDSRKCHFFRFAQVQWPNTKKNSVREQGTIQFSFFTPL